MPTFTVFHAGVLKYAFCPLRIVIVTHKIIYACSLLNVCQMTIVSFCHDVMHKTEHAALQTFIYLYVLVNKSKI